MATTKQKTILKYGTVIDQLAFDQILEMDDDDTHEFSRAIVYDFFTQAEDTFNTMDADLTKKDLKSLSELGHFLKGSSATLGLMKVKDHCEKIQHYGAKKDAAGLVDEDDEAVCLKRIKDTLPTLKKDYQESEKVLKSFYESEEK